MKLIAKALIEAQKKIKNAEKDSINPDFKNKYATLESVLDAVKTCANDSGIAIVQSAGKDENGHFLDTTLLHESGESVSSRIYLILEKTDMQGLGSALTYSRRYSLAALFAIGQDDDDGNAACIPTKEIKSTTTIKPKAAQENIPNFDDFVSGKESIGSYVIQVGKNKGKTLKELGKENVSKLYDWFSAQNEKKPVEGLGREFMNKAEIFLEIKTE